MAIDQSFCVSWSSLMVHFTMFTCPYSYNLRSTKQAHGINCNVTVTLICHLYCDVWYRRHKFLIVIHNMIVSSERFSDFCHKPNLNCMT